MGFPSDLLEARADDWNPADDEGDHITLAVTVTIAPSEPAYQAFQKRLCQRLKDVARFDGEFTTVMENHENLSLSDPCHLQPLGKPNYFREDMKRLMPDVEQAFAAGGSRPPLVIAVATLPSKDRTRIDWRYFVLDGLAGDAVLAAARRRASCKLTFLDANGEPVCVDRFDPCRDLFPNVPSTGRNPKTIPWNKYLSKVWCVDSRNTRDRLFDSVEGYELDSRQEPRAVERFRRLGSGKSRFMAVLHRILRGDPAARAAPESQTRQEGLE